MRTERYDILVLGSGIAGLFYAIRCAPFARVAIVTKGNIGESNTMYAQGGISAVFDSHDSIADHIRDTLTAGDGLCHRDAVEMLVSNAKAQILELEKLHVHFDKTDKGAFDLHREGGHSCARVVHTADATGREVENSLIKIVRGHPNITICEGHFAVDLIVEDEVCRGATILTGEGKTVHLLSKITLLATGGAGQVFAHNSNPAVATGDGFAMAARAGAQMMNMEFVQFHPTTLYAPGQETFLISEAVRGFGAELKHADGETFMERYHPMRSLAPRDIVSRAIIAELGRTGASCVYLDLRGFDQAEIQKHFPNIYQKCIDQGLDLTRDMIPVVPAAHYMCGGVQTDLKGRSSVKNLYCCGECAGTGVHGANRLASNSLLEGLVFASKAALDAESVINGIEAPGDMLTSEPLTISQVKSNTIHDHKRHLQNIMWDLCGILRRHDELKQCEALLQQMHYKGQIQLNKFGISRDQMEMQNMIETSLMIVRSALLREESRGCHYRTDYPKKADIAEDTILTNVEIGNVIETFI
jgi:L-aspartate oxidase